MTLPLPYQLVYTVDCLLPHHRPPPPRIPPPHPPSAVAQHRASAVLTAFIVCLNLDRWMTLDDIVYQTWCLMTLTVRTLHGCDWMCLPTLPAATLTHHITTTRRAHCSTPGPTRSAFGVTYKQLCQQRRYAYYQPGGFRLVIVEPFACRGLYWLLRSAQFLVGWLYVAAGLPPSFAGIVALLTVVFYDPRLLRHSSWQTADRLHLLDISPRAWLFSFLYI